MTDTDDFDWDAVESASFALEWGDLDGSEEREEQPDEATLSAG
ncbi:hypothetical protein ABT034_33520 [Streptomyces sp. NPDC002773]